MIISFPTALYKSILPGPKDEGNVTWTISSNDPPRPPTVPSPIQRGGAAAPLPPKIYDPAQRRLSFGELVFSLSYGSTTRVGVGNKPFEAGQILDFDDSDAPPVIVNNNVPDVIDIQQNTNLLNLADVGLSKDEVDSLTLAAQQRFTDTVTSLNKQKTDIADHQTLIQDNQRLLNEVSKAISAATVALGGTDTDIVPKLITRQNVLLSQRETLTSELNALNTQADATYQQLISLRELVR